MDFGYFIHLVMQQVGFFLAPVLCQDHLGAGSTAENRTTSFPFKDSDPGCVSHFQPKGFGKTTQGLQVQHTRVPSLLGVPLLIGIGLMRANQLWFCQGEESDVRGNE